MSDVRITTSDGQTVILSVREGEPAINVKDDTLWARHPAAGPLIEAIGEERAEAIYQGIQSDFWECYAQTAADEFGYGKVYAAGRSSGWLIVENTPSFLDETTDDDWVDTQSFPAA